MCLSAMKQARSLPPGRRRRRLWVAVLLVGCLVLIGWLALRSTLRRNALPPRVPPREAMAIALAAQADDLEIIRHDHAAAMQLFRRALEVDPGNRHARGGMALSLHRAGNDAEAIPLWKSLAALDDGEGRAARKWLSKVGASP